MDVQASVIVPLQGGPEQALRCFESLAVLPEVPEHEVIVVDDASVGLEELLGRLAGDVTIVTLEARAGFAGAVNRALAEANGAIVAMLRGAPEVGRDWLAPLVDALADERAGLAASVTAGAAETHPVAAYAAAVHAADLRALGGVPAVPDGLELGALATAIAGCGKRVEAVAASYVAAPGARMGAARRSPGPDPELSIVIPTLDAASERVRRCVSAIQRTTDTDHEIVVVDNGAPPQGFTAPVNSGVRAARGRYVVVMNDDVEVLPGWWAPLRSELDAGAAVAFPLTVDGPMRTDFAAWCFAVSRAAIDMFGHAPDQFFDPGLRVWFQDTDLLLRLRAAGSPPALVERSRIRHGLSETVASDDPELSAWIRREIVGDRERFLAKHPGTPAAGEQLAAAAEAGER